jgi:hypothetical protein
VFGARFVLKIWFPMQQPGTNSSSGSSRVDINMTSPSTTTSADVPTRFLLLPSDSTDSNASYTTYSPEVGIFTVQPIHSAQAIEHLGQRFPSDDVNQQDDYSFLNTPVVNATSSVDGRNRSSNGTADAALIRHTVRPNARLVALVDNVAAWGSPPRGQVVSMSCRRWCVMWRCCLHWLWAALVVGGPSCTQCMHMADVVQGCMEDVREHTYTRGSSTLFWHILHL